MRVGWVGVLAQARGKTRRETFLWTPVTGVMMMRSSVVRGIEDTPPPLGVTRSFERYEVQDATLLVAPVSWTLWCSPEA